MSAFQDEALSYLWTGSMPMRQLRDIGPIVFTRGLGCYLYDDTGQRYIDAMSGAWVVNVGHGDQRIIEAIVKQLHQLEFVLVEGYVSSPAVNLAKKLAAIAPGELGRTFFTTGGSEAIESAIKMAKQFWYSRQEPRYKVIARRSSYHGATFQAMSVTGFEDWRHPFLPQVPGAKFAPHPYCFQCELGLRYPECQVQCVDEIEAVIQREGPESVAAVIAEPISMSVGTAIPPDEYWPRLRAICDKYGVLLIADEIITGFGRSGEMFGCNHWNIEPDIMCVGKGITSGYQPLAASIAKPHIAEAMDEQGFIHGFTYSGHPVSCAAALANIEAIEEDDLVTHAREQGAHFLGALKRELLDYPFVGDIRGKGMLLTIDLVANRGTRARFPSELKLEERLKLFLLEHGVACRVGTKILLGPPLIMDDEVEDQLVRVLKSAMDWVAHETRGSYAQPG